MTRNKALGMDGITSDIIKLGRQIVLTYLTNIFNNIPKTKQTPDSRHEAKIVSLFKQGDPKTSRTKAYKPPATHRLLQTIIKRSLDENWPEEQAGFRKCYSTSDHLQTLNQIIDKSNECNLILCIGALRKTSIKETNVKFYKPSTSMLQLGSI